MVTNKLKFNKVNLNLIDEYSKRINSEFKDGKIGYFHLPKSDLSNLNELSEFSKKFSEFVVVGMGGSSLGIKAVFGLLENDKKVHFLDNLDICLCEKVLNSINFKKTLFFIISKSGTTIETITIFKFIINKFSVKDFSKNFIFITDGDSNLEKFGLEHGIKTFNIPKNVGGRFSVLSAAGLVPFTCFGFDVQEILDGASACAREFFIEKNDNILQKAYHYTTHKSAKINVIFSYGSKFEYFNEWYIQLWAESLGKKREYKRLGLTPVALIGSKDQHSFLQLIMDGVKDKTVTFIKVKADTKEKSASNLSFKYLESCDFVNGFNMSEILNLQCDATMQAIINEGISVDSLELECLDEWHIGYLLYYYMLLTSVTGIMLNINTYNQPGVEIGKRLLKTLLIRG